MSGARRVAVLGLGRSGVAAARLALKHDREVFASESADDVRARDAADVVRAAGGEAETGGHTVAEIARCDLLVVSPGIPPTAPVLQDPGVRAVPTVSELEFAYRHLNRPVIAVTGTNGKTTTTALIAHLLTAAGVDAVAAGNIGRALSDVAAQDEVAAWIVVEASSYQLAGIDRFRADVGVVTNLAPDHLDRYATVEAYYADKRRLFENADDDSVWVLNGDDPRVLDLAGAAPGRRLVFRVAGPLDAGVDGAHVEHDGTLALRIKDRVMPLLKTDELPLLGAHNRANALAAALAAFAVLQAPESLSEALRTFRAPPHRLEPVGESHGVLWINDSKATNLASTRVALRSVDRPTVLLLGGRHKGEPYTGLLPDLGRVRTVVAYGEAARLIEAQLGEYVPVRRVDGPFEEVVAAAAELARSGDVVLLSPACSSFDMFRDYEERGEAFRRLARRSNGTVERSAEVGG
ncbi:MAG: UDP-N-acetylmuramoyl-L-alanine--D-glutamate ligase [Gemmatimonadota bacterium]